MGSVCYTSINVVKTDVSSIFEQNPQEETVQTQKRVNYKINLSKLYLDYLNSIITDQVLVDSLKFYSDIVNPSIEHLDFTNSSRPRYIENNENSADAIARQAMVLFFFLDFCSNSLRKQECFNLVDQFIMSIKMGFLLKLSTYTNFLCHSADQWEEFITKWISQIIEIQERCYRVATQCKPKGFQQLQSKQLTILQDQLEKIENFDNEQTNLAKKIVINLINCENYCDEMSKYCKSLQKHLTVNRVMKLLE